MKQVDPAFYPLAFSPANRYSDLSKPPIGKRCRFSYAIQLTNDLYASKAFQSSDDRPWIYNGALCTVMGHSRHLVRVLFDHTARSDVVSRCFLIPLKLTEFGRAVLASKEASAQTIKSILGAHEA